MLPRLMRLAYCVALLAVSAASLRAQATPKLLWGGTFGVGGVQREPESEPELAAIFQLNGQLSWRWFSVRAAPLDLAMMRAEEGESRYYEDCFDNGQCRCRDSETGRFANSSLCMTTPTLKYYVSAEAAFVIPMRSGRSIELGGGYRQGTVGLPYGTLSWLSASPTARHYYLRGSVGDQFVNLSIGGQIPLGH